MFIRDFRLPNIAGYTPIHLLVPFTLGGLFLAFRHLLRGNIVGHRQAMVKLYLGACLAAGAFTLLPSRCLGQLGWGQGLAMFWQIHHGTVVRATAIDSANRNGAGKLFLRLRGRSESWPVSRLYAARFRAM